MPMTLPTTSTQPVRSVISASRRQWYSSTPRPHIGASITTLGPSSKASRHTQAQAWRRGKKVSKPKPT